MLALLVAACREGSWAAVVGVPDLGLLAAAELGVPVRRLATVPHPGSDPAAVVAALLDGIELIAFTGAAGFRSDQLRRLTARARQRGAVLLPLGGWPGADVELRCRSSVWSGAGTGDGRLRQREFEVTATGRGAAARPRRARLMLPAPSGRVAPVPGLDEGSGSACPLVAAGTAGRGTAGGEPAGGEPVSTPQAAATRKVG